MSSEINNQSSPEQGIIAVMEDLVEMLRAEVLPTHLALVQLIGKVGEDPTLKQVDLYSKYTRLAAVVGGDWITVKEELRNATSFGAPALYCSISSMLAVLTCRRSRSHDELVSSLTELYNHISTGNETLNKQVEHAITTMGRQMEHLNKAEAKFANFNERVDIAETHISNIVERADRAITTMDKQVEQVAKAETSIANVVERADHAITTMDKQVEQVAKAETSIANVVERADHAITTIDKQVEQVVKAETSIANIVERADNAINTISKQMKQTNIDESPSTASESPKESKQKNVDVVPIPGATFECKYGSLTIDDNLQFNFKGNSLDAKKLAIWFTLPIPLIKKIRIMNLDHEYLIKSSNTPKLSLLNKLKTEYTVEKKIEFLNWMFLNVKRKAGQWTFIC